MTFTNGESLPASGRLKLLKIKNYYHIINGDYRSIICSSWMVIIWGQNAPCSTFKKLAGIDFFLQFICEMRKATTTGRRTIGWRKRQLRNIIVTLEQKAHCKKTYLISKSDVGQRWLPWKNLKNGLMQMQHKYLCMC